MPASENRHKNKNTNNPNFTNEVNCSGRTVQVKCIVDGTIFTHFVANGSILRDAVATTTCPTCQLTRLIH